MSRVENAVRVDAVKGSEPRTPELEIPRLFGAGVGARLNLAFELGICPECGWRLVEHNGLLVCEGCGLVLAPVYEPPKFKPADSFNGSSISSGGFAQRALEALAGELGVPAGAALEVYKRLKRAGVGEAAAIALFVSAKRCGSYISLKRACELLSKCGVKADYPRAGGGTGSSKLVSVWGRFQPLPYPAPAERPPLVRGGIVGGVEKVNGTTPGPGRRVWKIRVNRVNKDRLKVLYNDVIRKRYGNIPKGLLYYTEEWARMFENTKRMREEAGKRTPPKTPPLPLLVRFVMPDGRERGNTAAPAIIDLRKGELRIPSYGIVQRLRRSLVRALIEENLLEPRPDFVLQVTRRGFLRVVAHRRLRARLEPPLRIVSIDENSRYGHSLAHWYINETKVAMAGFEKLRPANHGFRREIAALLQSYADKPGEETKRQLAKFLPPEVLRVLTTEGARELAEKTGEREKRLNSDFVCELVAKVRTLVRDAVRRGVSALILVEAIDSNSLRGTELQGTLLRGRRRLQNLAVYEGAKVGEASASGKVCPRCGTKGVEVVHTKRSRIYECPRCGLRWDRDKGVHYNMVYSYFARMVKEECDDDSVLAERVLSLLREWLEEHSHTLAY